MTRILGTEHKPLLDALVLLLKREPDMVKQQIAIELLTVWHAMRLEDKADFVADSMHKHVKQLLRQYGQPIGK